MNQRTGFSGGFSRVPQQKHVKVVIVASFILMVLLAIGVPLLRKPAVVAPLPANPAIVAVPDVDIFMPLQRIPAGTAMNSNLFQRQKMGAQAAAALGGQVVKSETEILGRYAKNVILPGRPLMFDQLVDAPENLITRKIRPGYRAVTIKVDDVSGIEGWSTPGAKVDVLWASQQGAEMVVSTIVRSASVLSVSGRADSSSGGMKSGAAGVASSSPPPIAVAALAQAIPTAPPTSFTVTLLVTPQDGQKIFLASTSGKMSLMLRGEFDAGQDGGADGAVTTRRLLQGATGESDDDHVEGTAKTKREDGSVDEWSVVQGRVMRWGRAD